MRRLGVKSMDPKSPCCMTTVTDGPKSMRARGRSDYISDESVVSASFAEKTVLSGIGKFTKIDKNSI